MIISARHRYADFRASNTTEDFERWGASNRLTAATNPLVRGTRSLGGGMIPLKNVLLFRK